MARWTWVLAALLLAGSVFGAAAAGESRAAGAPAAPAASSVRPIQDHLGIAGIAFIGQPHKDLIEAFPRAQVIPFAGQEDAFTVKIAPMGISCVVAGPSPEELRVASIGFLLEGPYEGISPGVFRTARGIGNGSTVNDLLEAYGSPAEIVTDRAFRIGNANPDDPAIPKLYQYPNESASVTMSFVVQRHHVVRIAIHDLEPLNRHILRKRPAG